MNTVLRLAVLPLAIASLSLGAARSARAENSHTVLSSNDPDATLEVIDSSGEATASAGNVIATGYSRTHHTVCTIPCKKPLDRNSLYYVESQSGYRSTPFTLRPNATVIDHDRGSRAATVALILTSALGISAGASLAGYGAYLELAKKEHSREFLWAGAGAGVLACGAHRPTIHRWLDQHRKR
jgi:hypothetical protein